MCSIDGPFKLCTCSGVIDQNKPYWRLRKNRLPDLLENMSIGQSYPLRFFDLLEVNQEEQLVEILNTEEVFDFDYEPARGDILEMYFPDVGFFVFKFKNRRWRRLSGSDHRDNLIDFHEEMTGYFRQI